MDPIRPRRVNGLAPPFTAAQLSTWFLLPLLVLEFLFFVSPLLPIAASIPCTLVFVGLAISAAYYAYLAMSTDPKDPRLDPEHTDSTNASTKQCWICDVQVGEKSMHCKFCNKCVDHFDHHCMWLNTCVGKANYTYFFRTMVSITLLLVVQIAVQLALVLDILLGNNGSKERAEDWFNADAPTVLVVILCVFLVFDFGALSLIGQLLVFHLKLQRQGLTTYSYIVRDNQRRREKVKQDNELLAKRDLEMERAKAGGQTWHFRRLQWAGMTKTCIGVACCDPLAEPEEIPESNGNGTAPKEDANGSD